MVKLTSVSAQRHSENRTSTTNLKLKQWLPADLTKNTESQKMLMPWIGTSAQLWSWWRFSSRKAQAVKTATEFHSSTNRCMCWVNLKLEFALVIRTRYVLISSEHLHSNESLQLKTDGPERLRPVSDGDACSDSNWGKTQRLFGFSSSLSSHTSGLTPSRLDSGLFRQLQTDRQSRAFLRQAPTTHTHTVSLCVWRRWGVTHSWNNSEEWICRSSLCSCAYHLHTAASTPLDMKDLVLSNVHGAVVHQHNKTETRHWRKV